MRNITDVTYNELVDMIDNSKVGTNEYYRITDFRTRYKMPNVTPDEYVEATVEPIIVKGTSQTTIYHEVTSESYPNDIIQYTVNNLIIGADRGTITYRKDLLVNNSAFEDFRGIMYRRWETINGSGVYDSATDTGNDSQDFVVFGSSSRDNEFRFTGGLGNNIVLSNCDSNILSAFCVNNTFLPNSNQNSLGQNCENNLFSDECDGNILGDNCSGNQFISNAGYYSIQGCKYNTLGHECDNNTFDYGCEYNHLGNNCVSSELSPQSVGNKFERLTDVTFNNAFSYVSCDFPITTGTYNNTVNNINIFSKSGNGSLWYSIADNSGVVSTNEFS